MKKFYYSVLFFLMLSQIAEAQTPSSPSVEKKQFTYHLLLKASYEVGVSRLNTVRVSGPLEMGLFIETFTDNYASTTTEYGYFARPMLSGEFRHYYNLDKRLAQGKRVDKNSGNFVAPVVRLFGPAFIKSDKVETADFGGIIGAVWGIQRNYGKSFNFQLSIGPGIGFADEVASFTPIGELSLGFRIGQ